MQSHAMPRASSAALPSVPLSPDDRDKVLRFAASFLWADFEVVDEERRFFTSLARELDVDDARARDLLARPPVPEELDPYDMSARTADVIRHVALRAIASDGEVREEEMQMFELLDDLMPRSDGAREPDD